MPKLKDLSIKDWPEKFEAGKENWDGSIITKREEAIGNYHLNLINNLEFNPAELLDVDKVEEELKSVCLKITPNFNGLIFIQDNYHTPPNNWTRISIKTLAQAIVDSRDIIK